MKRQFRNCSQVLGLGFRVKELNVKVNTHEFNCMSLASTVNLGVVVLETSYLMEMSLVPSHK